VTVPNIAGQLWGTQHANRALDAEIANNEANRRQRDQQFYTQLFAGPAMQTGFGLLGSYVKELMPTEAQAREIQKYGFDRAKKSDNRTDFLTDVLASYGATRTGPKGAMEVNVGEPVQAGAVPAPVAPKVETPNSFTDGSAPSLDMLGKQSSVFDPSRYSLRGSASVTPALGGLDENKIGPLVAQLSDTSGLAAKLGTPTRGPDLGPVTTPLRTDTGAPPATPAWQRADAPPPASPVTVPNIPAPPVTDSRAKFDAALERSLSDFYTQPGAPYALHGAPGPSSNGPASERLPQPQHQQPVPDDAFMTARDKELAAFQPDANSVPQWIAARFLNNGGTQDELNSLRDTAMAQRDAMRANALEAARQRQHKEMVEAGKTAAELMKAGGEETQLVRLGGKNSPLTKVVVPRYRYQMGPDGKIVLALTGDGGLQHAIEERPMPEVKPKFAGGGGGGGGGAANAKNIFDYYNSAHLKDASQVNVNQPGIDAQRLAKAIENESDPNVKAELAGTLAALNSARSGKTLLKPIQVIQLSDHISNLLSGRPTETEDTSAEGKGRTKREALNQAQQKIDAQIAQADRRAAVAEQQAKEKNLGSQVARRIAALRTRISTQMRTVSGIDPLTGLLKQTTIQPQLDQATLDELNAVEDLVNQPSGAAKPSAKVPDAAKAWAEKYTKANPPSADWPDELKTEWLKKFEAAKKAAGF